MEEIPLNGGAEYSHQSFTVPVGGKDLDITIDYITVAGPAWSMNVSVDGKSVIDGAMLEPGAEVSEGYNAGIGRLYFVGKEVTLDNLGKENRLIWVPE